MSTSERLFSLSLQFDSPEGHSPLYFGLFDLVRSWTRLQKKYYESVHGHSYPSRNNSTKRSAEIPRPAVTRERACSVCSRPYLHTGSDRVWIHFLKGWH